ncbi:neuronal acetylcholine receptor subunit alpha-3-like isoform X1 [Aplysia californica]|uniref:Neuronal acetylcholine receptor subunit alpha-3-like isoform X1 n=1 Tax=Aplysia californica TaxID=6500 RepID=A0ABM0JPI6_APLCA|nr:neuronal acetylcholine receptor subunit alpha-3-like isoform X1 [Aplysia californica]
MACMSLVLLLALSVMMSSEAVAAAKRESGKGQNDFDNELNITSKEKLLVKRLLKRYDKQGKEGRPVVNTSDAVRVEFGLSLIQILDVDIKDQVLKTNIWYEYNWNDMLLRWDKEQYDNISDVRIPSDKIWLPDILLYNFADDRLKEQRNALSVVNSEGHVLWMPQAILRSSCAFDTLFFPLDEQTCILKFGSWTYNGLKLDIHFIPDRDKFELGEYIENNEWHIVENSGARHVKKYTCCPEPYPDLKFKLRLRRRVAFYTFILIMPCALLSLLTMVIFWVPPESPAKLTLGMNIFLAYFLLLLVLADTTPKATARIPLIGAYFCMNMVMITMSEILACMVANMHFRGVRINRVPKVLRLFMINFMARVLCLRDKIIEKDSTPVINCPPKKRWNVGRVGGDNTRPQYPYTDITCAQVRLLNNDVEKRQIYHEGGDGGGGDGRGGPESRGGGDCGGSTGFQFPPIGDEFLSHVQSNAKVLEEVKSIREILERVKEKKARAEEKDKLAREWRIVAMVFDRIIFAIYVVINFTGLLVIFIWQINREEQMVKGFENST